MLVFTFKKNLHKKHVFRGLHPKDVCDTNNNPISLFGSQSMHKPACWDGSQELPAWMHANSQGQNVGASARGTIE